jgi:hypothetical protein
MGGGGGRGADRELRELVDSAKKKLAGLDEVTRRNVFISFDHDDLDEVNLLRGQAKNENSPIDFNDWSVQEPFNSARAPYIKAKIGERIAQSSVTVVYLTDKTRTSSWVAWEVSESIRLGKHVIGVHKGTSPPSTLPSWVRQHGVAIVPWSELSKSLDTLK